MVLTDWKLTWPSKSNSFLELQERTARPLFVSMSNLANLAGSAIKATHDVRTVHALLDSIQQFSHSVASQWKTNRLSSVPMPEEVRLVDEQSLKVTIPVVWQILKLVLFTTIIILQGLITRITQYPTFYRRDSKHILSSEVISSWHCLTQLFQRLRQGSFKFYMSSISSHQGLDLEHSHPIILFITLPSTSSRPALLTLRNSYWQLHRFSVRIQYPVTEVFG